MFLVFPFDISLSVWVILLWTCLVVRTLWWVTLSALLLLGRGLSPISLVIVRCRKLLLWCVVLSVVLVLDSVVVVRCWVF